VKTPTPQGGKPRKTGWPLLPSLALTALLVALVLAPSRFHAQVVAQQPAPAALPTLDVVRDFGAKGDGRSDDTGAFLRLAREVNRRDGGVQIVIPPATYRVGGQVPNGRNADGLVYRFDGLDVLALKGCRRPVQITAAGAVLRLPDGLRFGSFDGAGRRFDPPALPFYDSAQSGITGYLVSAVGCADVSISGLELDGNNTRYILGGAWGDKDRQCRSYGLFFSGCDRVQLDGVSAHHFGLDGIYIKTPGLHAGDPQRPHILRDCRFEWNARQGLSWSGGIGLQAQRCSFAHTGYAVNVASGAELSNSPGAGVDIEAERSVCRDGQFVDCDFFHTKGPSLYVETGDNADASFSNCRFWNFQNYALVPNAPRLRFTDCRIYGAATSAFSSRARPSDATRFERCTFEDKAHPTLGAPFVDAYGSLLGFDNLQGGLLFQDCTFIAHNVKGPFLRNPLGGQTNGFQINGGTMRLEHWNGPGESVATLQGGRISNFRINGAFTKTPPAGLHVWTNNQTIAGSGLEVQGSGLRWRAPDGEQGQIR